MDSEVLPTELVARFVVHRDEVRADRVLRPQLFKPAKSDNGCSVFRRIGLDEDGIWACAKWVVAEGRNPIGRADLPVSAVLAAGLVLIPDDNPPNHALIAGFSEEINTKRDQLQQLAKAAIFVERPSDSISHSASDGDV